MLRSISILGLLLFLASCSSSPAINYYVLSPNGTTATTASQQQSIVGVGPVSIPEYLHRTQIAYSMYGNKLVLSQYDRWSEPVDKAISRVVAVNLSRADPMRTTLRFPWRRADEPQYSVQISILDLNRISATQAVLTADWAILDAGSKKTIHRGKFSEIASVENLSYLALTESYSDLLAQLSDNISLELHEQLRIH